MVSPINYQTDVQTPFQSAIQGYNAGITIQDNQQAQQQQAAAQQQQQALMQARQTVMANPTADNFSKLILLDPKAAESTQRAWDLRNQAQQQTFAGQLGQYGAALVNKQPQLVADGLNKEADAIENTFGGPTQDSQSKRDLAKVVTTNPDLALGKIIALLKSNDAGKPVADALLALQTRPADIAKAEAEASSLQSKATVDAASVPDKARAAGLANQELQSQMDDRRKRFQLDADKFQSEVGLKVQELKLKQGELPEFVAKDVTSAATDSIAAAQSASRMTDLAARIEQAGMASGALAKGGELLKRFTGNQNEYTRMRSQYSQIVTPAAMAAYKKVASGSTSDKDIDTAMTGVPAETADPSTMAAYLRGAAKLQVYDSVINNARSEWLQAVHSLGKSPRDIEVDGVTVPAGTTFKAFTDAYVAKKVEAQTGAMNVSTRGYMRFAQPGAAGAPAAPLDLTDAMTGGQ